MNPVPALAVLLICIVLGSSAVAQRTFSFEEACRNAGWTTGPCAPKSSQQETIMCVRSAENAFHGEKASPACREVSLSPAYDAEIIVELIGLPNLQKLNDLQVTIGRASGLQTASALFYESAPECRCSKSARRQMRDGSRVVIYDPQWAAVRTAEVYLTLAHEAGHHICGHSLGRDPLNRRNEELEADRFSGASIRRFEVYHGKRFLDDALKAANRLYRETGAAGHPPRAERIEAIVLGYKSGSPCGNLAPAIRGYSPQPR